MRIHDDSAAGNNRPPAGGKRRLIREGGSASRVGMHTRPRDPGGGTVSTDPPRRTVLNYVSVAVEQPGEEPSLISYKCLTVQTGQASADDTHKQECSHDVVGLYAHKGTMWNSDDCVPRKNVKSPYGGGESPLPGAAGGPPSAMFPVMPALLADEPQLDSWQVAVVRVDETPAGDSSDQDFPCDTQNRHRPMDTDNLPNNLVHTVVQGGPVGPQGIEPLALLVCDHADPAGQHAVIQKKLLGPVGPKVKEPLALLVLSHADPAGQHAATQSTTSLWKGLPAQPEPSRGGGLVEWISDEEPTVRQVSGSVLDSQLMEGITYLEHPAQGVSLDSRPMEGSSCLKPVEQSILRSPRITRLRVGSDLVENISDEEPTVCQVPGSALDSQLMEGITQPEHLALGVSLDSGGIVVYRTSETVNSSIIAV